MLTAPSLHRAFALVYSGDPALDLPADTKERERVLASARETGHWPTFAGQEPTLFTCRSLHGAPLTWLLGEARRKQLSQDELCELAFRLALTEVVNLGNVQVQREVRGEQLQLTADTLAAIYAIGDGTVGIQVVLELGAAVLRRAMEGIAPRR